MKAQTTKTALLAIVVTALLGTTLMLAPEKAHALGNDPGPSIVTKGSAVVNKSGYYVVRRGDTLWDICSAYFGRPWFWPTLWSYNPQLTNPHWIYPGDLLLMRSKDSAKSTLVWSKSRYSQAPANVEVLARWNSYMPDKKIKEAGTIQHAREEQEFLSEYDEIYISFKKDTTVKRGERFTIFRDDGPIEHPWTGDVVGRKIRNVGVARVLDAKNDLVKALIIKSYEEIKRGDMVSNILPHSWIVNPRVNDRRVLATLIDTNGPVRFAAKWQYVIIDKGSKAGVKRGNRFLVQRRGDGRDEGAKPIEVTDDEDEEKEKNRFPWETVGEVMVVKTFEKSSLGVLVRSIRELSKGERLLMKKGY